MIKRNYLKKLATTVLAVTMTIVSVPIGVLADHPAGNYTDGRRCNNTYRSYSHTAYLTSVSRGSHKTSEGITCTISGLVYEHNVCCSVCGYSFGKSSFTCTTAHSKCGTTIVEH